jgi:hypothetical protein
VAVPRYNQQIVAQGLARLTSAFITKPNVRAWLAVILQPWQDLEDATWDVLTGRFLSTAEILAPTTALPGNVVFDILGELVGQSRNGLADVEYRAFLYLRIAANRAKGLTTDWSNFAAIILKNFAAGPVSFYESGAGLFLGVWGFSGDDAETSIPNLIAQALHAAVPNGVNGVFAYTTWPDTGGDFEWDDTTNPSTTGNDGWGDSVSGAVGGMLVSGIGI